MKKSWERYGHILMLNSTLKSPPSLEFFFVIAALTGGGSTFMELFLFLMMIIVNYNTYFFQIAIPF